MEIIDGAVGVFLIGVEAAAFGIFLISGFAVTLGAFVFLCGLTITGFDYLHKIYRKLAK